MNTEAGRQEPRCNLEFKARLASLEAAQRRAQELTTRDALQQFQVDTYFHCPQGRLKLREINQSLAQLIWYQRADEAAARESHYHLVEISDNQGIFQLLQASLGIRSRVEKQRTVYWYENVRIHLDDVGSLGTFIEFEAVVTTEAERAAADGQLTFLSEHFQINANDLLTMSYGDMIEAAINAKAAVIRDPLGDK